ncbi:hypothetical protein M8J76_003418 [Diaphorina citri]|nr:hypothetical protein M8J76_003418 [Diaphorina citri]
MTIGDPLSGENENQQEGAKNGTTTSSNDQEKVSQSGAPQPDGKPIEDFGARERRPMETPQPFDSTKSGADLGRPLFGLLLLGVLLSVIH